MKKKPKIKKLKNGWVVTRPIFGFRQTADVIKYPTQKSARNSLKSGCTTTSGSCELAPVLETGMEIQGRLDNGS